MKYFAYGSNMSRKRLENQKWGDEKIGHVEDLGIGVLRGYELKFNKISTQDGYGRANILLKEKSKVMGVVYELSEEQLKLLDTIEKGYSRCPDIRVDFKNKKLTVDTYFACNDKINEGLLPSEDYLNYLIRGAQEHDFPKEYIAELESWLNK